MVEAARSGCGWVRLGLTTSVLIYYILVSPIYDSPLAYPDGALVSLIFESPIAYPDGALNVYCHLFDIRLFRASIRSFFR
jgi:hypothetical protein